MKPISSAQKLRGGYYTEKIIADFLAEWAIQSPSSRVLEPSCGDGALLESAIEVLERKGVPKSAIASQLYGIEIDPTEAQKAAERVRLSVFLWIQLIFIRVISSPFVSRIF